MTLYSSPFFPNPPFQTAVVVSGTGRTFVGRTVQAFGSLSGNGVGFNFVDPNGPTELSNATGLLSADALVLTDSRTGERVTYRKR
jgi:hypothetical protein